MHKTQAKWGVTKDQLNQALAQYAGTPTELSRASGVNFYAARRFLQKGVGSKGANAIRLCAFFGVGDSKSAQAESVELSNLYQLLDEVWDGSRPHAELLAKLIDSTRSYKVEERGSQD